VPVLSYVVLPAAGAAAQVAKRLAAIPGCQVARAGNRDLLILLTETDGTAADHALRTSLEQMNDIRSITLAFGEVA